MSEDVWPLVAGMPISRNGKPLTYNSVDWISAVLKNCRTTTNLAFRADRK